jgi:hypothetical protein
MIMKTVEMYEIGEVVLIKASVTDVVVDQGKLKYKLRVEHTNNDLEHTFTENQMQPMPNLGLDEDDGRFSPCGSIA